jgi:hypothetical protein
MQSLGPKSTKNGRCQAGAKLPTTYIAPFSPTRKLRSWRAGEYNTEMANRATNEMTQIKNLRNAKPFLNCLHKTLVLLSYIVDIISGINVFSMMNHQFPVD